MFFVVHAGLHLKINKVDLMVFLGGFVILMLVPTGNWGRQEEGGAGRHRRDDSPETPDTRAGSGQEEDGEGEPDGHSGSVQTGRGQALLLTDSWFTLFTTNYYIFTETEKQQ